MKRLFLYIAVVSACLGLSVGAWAVSDPLSAADDQAQIEFLRRHWQAPIPLQGRSPAHFSPMEASLDAEGCAVCHRGQYEDWGSSLHSKRPPETYWPKMQAVCRKYDVLLIADEVITGFGRTGRMFASDLFGIEPDFMTLSKQLTSSRSEERRVGKECR